jgi:hypothetical protein
MSVSPRKSPFIVFITPSIQNKNGGDRLRKMSISSIFEEEILENCRFWEVQTSGFGLSIIYPNYLSCFKVVPEPGQRNSFSKRLFVPQNTTVAQKCKTQNKQSKTKITFLYHFYTILIHFYPKHETQLTILSHNFLFL